MKLSFMGDINFRNFDGITFEKSKEILVEVEEELKNVDYRIVNLETPLADKAKHMPIPKSGPNHMYSPKCVSFLKALKTDIAVLANNYMGWCFNHQWFPYPPKEYGGLKNKLADVKNIVTCEAHLEMTNENYRILNDGDEEIAKEYGEKIIELSKMSV